MGCYESKPDTYKAIDHKSKNKLSKLSIERLNRECKLLKSVTSANRLHNFGESRKLIKEYYSQNKCNKKTGKECQYIKC